MHAMLPCGFYDLLAPAAATEARALESLIKRFSSYGYVRAIPPLMEFEDSLLAGPGATLNRSTFRVMDGESQRMLGLRTDHTMQIGRIAATGLYDAPRPLRLAYAGTVLRLKAGEGNPARQLEQVGVELIGSLAPAADAEIIQLAVDSLAQLGITDISIDILLPTLIPALCDAHKLGAATRQALHHALDRKDEALVQRMVAGEGGKVAEQALLLLRASGDAATAMAALATLELPAAAEADRRRLTAVMGLLGSAFPVPVTIDFVEYRGFEYQTGLSFTVFSRHHRSELGRGGRYRTASNEPATGITFYMHGIAPALPPARLPARIMVPPHFSLARKQQLMAEGYVVVQALEPTPALAMQAAAQQCDGWCEEGGGVQWVDANGAGC